MLLEDIFYCQESFSLGQVRLAMGFAVFASVFSLYGSSLMLVTHVTLGKTTALRSLVVGLALADFIVSVNNLSKGLLLLIQPAAMEYPVCVMFRVVWQASAGASICYTCALGVYVAVCLLMQRVAAPRWVVIALHGLSWLIPLALVLPMVPAGVIEQSEETMLCYPTEAYHMAFWFAPVALAILFNTMLFLSILLLIALVRRKSTISYSHQQLRTLAWRFSLYLCVLVVAWTPDIATYVFQAVFTDCRLLFLIIGYSSLVDLMGFFDGLVYGTTNPQYREMVAALLRTRDGLIRVSLFGLFAPLLVLPLLVYASVRHTSRVVLSMSATSLASTTEDDVMPDAANATFLAETSYILEGTTHRV